MKKISLLVLSILFMAATSCGDNKKEEQELDATLDKIEVVEQEIDETNEALDQKAAEVESALSELDNL